jgi:acyl carrier protein
MTPLSAERIRAILIEAVDEVNLQLPKEKKLRKADETTLTGEGTVLDSLTLMSLLVSVEEKVASESGLELSLADEAANATDATPLETLGTLRQFILSRSRATS